jgi:hypothetical protein
MLKGPENRHDAEVKNLYQAGAARNIARFHQAATAADFTNETVARSVDGALTTILGREAGLRRAKLTLQQVLAENHRQEVDLSGLKS